MNLSSIKRLYFVGIGGIGMSALARFFLNNGIEIFGYDKTKTVLTEKLEAEGCSIHFDDNVQKIPEGIDLVIYTPAIPPDHQELAYFRRNFYPVKKRAEVLGIISRSKRCIAMAGTHGKTTTSSMISFVLRFGGIDCSAFLGGIVKDYASNFVFGKSDWIVAEADEYDWSFLHLSPELAIISSVDADHLDIYKNENLMVPAFQKFADKVKPDGVLFLANEVFDKIEQSEAINYFRYGIEEGDYFADKIRVEEGAFVFDANYPDGKIENIKLQLAGRHNIENAMAAIAIAKYLNIENEKIKKAFAEFKGIHRRFDIRFHSGEKVYVDDYAHHPTELKAAIHAAKELYPGKKVTGIFQPHLYSRTRDFVEGFAEALDGLDHVIFLPIYPAREVAIPGVTSTLIMEKMSNENKVLKQKEELIEYLTTIDFEVLLTLGAGDIDVFVPQIESVLNHG
ncbi:MAG: UDP-N-acetylmuramate--L-alanine ligase [Bacteroidota bacterium]